MLERPPIFARSKIIRWMRQGHVCIRRDSADGFLYLRFHDGRSEALNQALAQDVIADGRVMREDYRAGWIETRPTGKTRWVIFWD